MRINMNFIKHAIKYLRQKITPTSSQESAPLISGKNLDAIAELIGLSRKPRESDEHLRQRIRERIFDFPTL